jgi:hypothetical protein
MYSDPSHESIYNLARSVLIRYIDIGCDLGEALELTERTLEGETITIRTAEPNQNQPLMTDNIDSQFLLDYLNDITGDLYDDDLYDDIF